MYDEIKKEMEEKMKSIFICGYCKKKTILLEKLPKCSRYGDKLQCTKCKKWQTFNGTMKLPKNCVWLMIWSIK